jgi:gliding motility-associated-like protein
VVTDACGNTATFIQYVFVTQTTDVTEVNDIERCNDTNNAQVDLLTLLPASTPEGGTWDYGTLTAYINGTVLSPLGIPENIYTVSYLIIEGPCPRRIDINVNIIFCTVVGCDNVIIHNAFTPNNDAQNLNEFFNIENINQECHLPNTVEIYNRWGVLVYEAENYDNDTKKFTGISEGRSTVNKSAELPTGTYFYIIKYSNSEGTTESKDGYLYLTR